MRTSDITQAEFLTLKAKMDGANPNAKTVAESCKVHQAGALIYTQTVALL